MSSRLAILLPLCLLTIGSVQAQVFKLSWSSVISGGRAEAGRATAVGPDGGIWVAGTSSSSPDFPGPNAPFQSAPKGKNDIFLAKYQPGADGGTTLLFWTWIGGTGDEEVRAMKIDSQGRIVVTGTTDSTDFPLAGNAFQHQNGGAVDAFIVVVDPAIAAEFSLGFSSYYGGTGVDTPNDLALGADGSIIVVGQTRSTDLPNVSGSAQPDNRGNWDAFLFKVNPGADSTLQYASYLGGKSTDGATGVAIDQRGIVWISGYTASDDFPVTADAYQAAISIAYDAFVVSLDPSTAGVDGFKYGTYFGGSGSDVPMATTFDAAGRLWMAWHTRSGDLPITGNAAQPLWGGEDDAYVISLDTTKPASEWIQYATYFGGAGYEVVYGFVLLPQGRFALAGYSLGGVPTGGGAYQFVPRSSFADSFVSILNSGVAGPDAIEYSTYFGGSYTDVGTGIAVDQSGAVIVTGYSDSPDYVTTDGSQRKNPPASPSGFVYKFTRNVS